MFMSFEVRAVVWWEIGLKKKIMDKDHLYQLKYFGEFFGSTGV
jgi:hypothetical protein